MPSCASPCEESDTIDMLGIHHILSSASSYMSSKFQLPSPSSNHSNHTTNMAKTIPGTTITLSLLLSINASSILTLLRTIPQSSHYGIEDHKTRRNKKPMHNLKHSTRPQPSTQAWGSQSADTSSRPSPWASATPERGSGGRYLKLGRALRR